MPADDEATLALLEKLEDFFGGPDLTTAISDFAAAHGAEFHPLPEGAEHPLQWHSRYLEYCGMIERQLEGFLQQHEHPDDDSTRRAKRLGIIKPPSVALHIAVRVAACS